MFTTIKILAFDQARCGAWSIFDSNDKLLLSWGEWSFPARKYEFSRAVYEITRIAKDLILAKDIEVVFIEDTQLRQNAQSFKKLAQLQGALINLFESFAVPYESVPPTRWQSYCGARSKAQSMEFVHSQFGIETDNDNLADAICIGWYAVNHMETNGCSSKEIPREN